MGGGRRYGSAEYIGYHLENATIPDKSIKIVATRYEARDDGSNWADVNRSQSLGRFNNHGVICSLEL